MTKPTENIGTHTGPFLCAVKELVEVALPNSRSPFAYWAWSRSEYACLSGPNTETSKGCRKSVLNEGEDRQATLGSLSVQCGAVCGAEYGALFGAACGAVCGAVYGALYGAVCGAVYDAVRGAVRCGVQCGVRHGVRCCVRCGVRRCVRYAVRCGVRYGARCAVALRGAVYDVVYGARSGAVWGAVCGAVCGAVWRSSFSQAEGWALLGPAAGQLWVRWGGSGSPSVAC